MLIWLSYRDIESKRELQQVPEGADRTVGMARGRTIPAYIHTADFPEAHLLLEATKKSARSLLQNDLICTYTVELPNLFIPFLRVIQ